MRPDKRYFGQARPEPRKVFNTDVVMAYVKRTVARAQADKQDDG